MLTLKNEFFCKGHAVFLGFVVSFKGVLVDEEKARIPKSGLHLKV